VQYVLVGIGWYGLFSVFIPVYGFLALAIAAAIFSDTERFLDRAATTQWGLMVCVYCISHIPALMTLEIPGYENRTTLLMVFVVLIAQVSDIMQYVWGKLIGRHLVAPMLSPSKTVEGLAGGVLSATVLGALLWRITPFSAWQAGLMAFLISILGFLGGLVMSAIKRDRGIKDWSNLIDGHGGMLDRIDSLCFSAPVFFHLTLVCGSGDVAYALVRAASALLPTPGQWPSRLEASRKSRCGTRSACATRAEIAYQ
jgi:phosphatidate cytidylyltransferase